MTKGLKDRLSKKVKKDQLKNVMRLYKGNPTKQAPPPSPPKKKKLKKKKKKVKQLPQRPEKLASVCDNTSTDHECSEHQFFTPFDDLVGDR